MSGLANLASVARERFTSNLGSTFSQMTAEKWIRVVVIVGAYLLLRPYLMKLGARSQMRAHEREEAVEEEQQGAEGRARVTPNELRGQKVVIPEDSDDDDDEAEAGGAAAARSSGADWGKRARRRQRQMVKKILEAEEQRLQQEQEDEEDKDIQEFLTQ